MKELNLNLKITFAEKITSDEEILEVMQNVLEALQKKVETGSVAPWEGDNYTEFVAIREEHSNQSITCPLV